MTDSAIETAKVNAGESAAKLVADGDVVGLGTGTTAARAIVAIGNRVDDGLDVMGIPTSSVARNLAQDVGIPLTTLDERTPTIAIDGADQVSDNNLIKGGGGAHTSEKRVATAAGRFIAVIDERKQSGVLDIPVPVAVVPDRQSSVAAAIRGIGGSPNLRLSSNHRDPVVTDDGNVIFDCEFGVIEDPVSVADSISSISGVVEHGLFLDMVDEIHCGTETGVTVTTFET